MNEPGRIVGAQNYLQQTLARGLPFAIVTGSEGTGKSMLIRRFLQDPSISHCAHLAAATGDHHAFLERVLEQLGFEPFDSSTEELRKLLTVFARHELAQGRRTVIVLEQAQDFGPRVLQTVQHIATEEPGSPAAVTFVLTGSAALDRILDSDGMADVAGLTHGRYSLDGPDLDDTAEVAIRRPALEIMAGGELLDRFSIDKPRIMIGRHAQNDLSIDNRFVSRHHALLVSREDAVYVVDLQSTNGTFVNARQVTREALKDGDVVQVGSHRLRYCEPEGSQRPVPADEPGDHVDTGVLGPRAIAS